MSKQSINLLLKSRNKTILSTILLNRISHLALERVLGDMLAFKRGVVIYSCYMHYSYYANQHI
jgi:hypothetical protein